MQPHSEIATIHYRRTATFGLAVLLTTGLLFAAAQAADEESRAIYVMQSDGTNVRNVVTLKDFNRLGNPRWSHNAKRLAFDASGNSKSTRLCTIDIDGKNLQDLGGGVKPAWSPDDQQLAFHIASPDGNDGGIWVENADGKGRGRLTDGLSPVWAPDGSGIALAAKSLRLFDMVETAQRSILDGQELQGDAVACDWSPDSKRLAVVIDRNGGRELILVKTEGQNQNPPTRLRANLHAVAWSPKEDVLAISIEDDKTKQQKLYLLKADGSDAPALIAGQEGDNREPTWSPDGSQLAFASSRTTGAANAIALGPQSVKLELVRHYDTPSPIFAVNNTPDGRMALVGGTSLRPEIHLWDLHSGELKRTFNFPAPQVATSTDGRTAAASLAPGGKVVYFNLGDGSIIRYFEPGAQPLALRFSRDAAKIAITSSDNSACVFNVESGEQVARMEHPARTTGVAFSPDNKLIVVGCADKKIYLWDVATGQKVREFELGQTPYPVSFSPDGTRIISGSGGDAVGSILNLNLKTADENPVCVWDVATGRLLREMKGHKHVVFGAMMSSDGKYIISGSWDHSLRLWDAEQGTELARVDGEGWVTSAIFLPDGTHVLAAGGLLKGFNSTAVTPFPKERLRLFKVVTSSAANAEK